MNFRRVAPAILCLCLSAGFASASSFSFTGNFVQDDQLAIFLFTAPSASLTVRTWSYAGGTNAAGQVISAGGFDPILSIFDATSGLVATSVLLGSNNDGAGVATDPTTFSASDSLLALSSLNPGGTYALVLSENDNSPNGPDFGSGFHEDGQGNFTASLCGGTAFCDVTPAQRNGSWAVDITGVRSAVSLNNAAPEPTSILLFSAGIAALALLRRRGQQSQQT